MFKKDFIMKMIAKVLSVKAKGKTISIIAMQFIMIMFILIITHL